MPTHFPPIRCFNFGGLVSGAGPVTGYLETGRPENGLLLLNILAAGTSWNVALSTGAATGAANMSAVSISGANNVSGNGTGLQAYRLQNKLSKYTYYALSGVGNPTLAAQLVGFEYFNSGELSDESALAGITPTQA